MSGRDGGAGHVVVRVDEDADLCTRDLSSVTARFLRPAVRGEEGNGECKGKNSACHGLMPMGIAGIFRFGPGSPYAAIRRVRAAAARHEDGARRRLRDVPFETALRGNCCGMSDKMRSKMNSRRKDAKKHRDDHPGGKAIPPTA